MKRHVLGATALSTTLMLGALACSSSSSNPPSGGPASSTGSTTPGESNKGSGDSRSGSSGNTSGSSPGSTDSSSSGNASSNGASSCSLDPGTYDVKYVKKGGSCPAPPDTKVQINSPDGGTSTPTDPDCKMTQDLATCTFTYECVKNTAGMTTTTKSVTKISNGAMTSESESKSEKDGSVVYECNLEATYTKE